MIVIYVTLNTSQEARRIGRELLTESLANCVNFFPIKCIYTYRGKITEEPEIVLLVKTKENYFEKVKKVIKKYVDYDNFIGQIRVEKVNDDFSSWLNDVVR